MIGIGLGIGSVAVRQQGTAKVEPITYTFIDGGSFTKLLEGVSARYLDGSPISVNWTQLRGQSAKVFYYDALSVPASDEGATEYEARIAPKRAQLSEIASQPGYHVRTGTIRRENRKRGNEQKMVDVQLAVNALLMASRGLFSRAILLTGDLDFLPLVEALVELGVHVSLWYPAGSANQELITAADDAKMLTAEDLRSWAIATPILNSLPSFADIYGDYDMGEVLAEWNDHRRGVVKVGTVRNNEHLLAVYCSESPRTLGAGIALVYISDIRPARLLAEDVLGITIPSIPGWG